MRGRQLFECPAGHLHLEGHENFTLVRVSVILTGREQLRRKQRAHRAEIVSSAKLTGENFKYNRERFIIYKTSFDFTEGQVSAGTQPVLFYKNIF